MADYDAATRKALLKKGQALPPLHKGGEPRFPIKNCGDVHDAVVAVNHVKSDADARKVRRYIIRIAKKLGCSNIPDTWNSDGSLKEN